ncbi:MAG: hypothetical protein IJ191_08650, partial [Treponema sp.]|nr:hypothetical protein [Treponema sp.]
QQFYSPNDSAAARIVYVRPAANGWQVQTVAPLPFVHRFDIISRGGVNYLIACTIKSDHHYKDDWSSPGKVYAAELPDDIARAGAVQPLHFTVVQDGLTKNHGYTRDMHDGVPTAIISAENGVFRFTPPAHRGGTWSVEQLLDTPASDAILCDLDGDGKKELAVMAPFHGDSFAIYAPDGERYRQVYVHPEPMEFLHAIAAGPVCGKERVIIGHREGKRALMAFTFERGAYRAEEIDRDCGPANVCVLRRDGVDVVVSAHRETNEIALYELLP